MDIICVTHFSALCIRTVTELNLVYRSIHDYNIIPTCVHKITLNARLPAYIHQINDCLRLVIDEWFQVREVFSVV